MLETIHSSLLADVIYFSVSVSPPQVVDVAYDRQFDPATGKQYVLSTCARGREGHTGIQTTDRQIEDTETSKQARAGKINKQRHTQTCSKMGNREAYIHTGGGGGIYIRGGRGANIYTCMYAYILSNLGRRGTPDNTQHMPREGRTLKLNF